MIVRKADLFQLTLVASEEALLGACLPLISAVLDARVASGAHSSAVNHKIHVFSILCHRSIYVYPRMISSPILISSP